MAGLSARNNSNTATEDVLPSAEDVCFYEEHGWYVSKQVLPDALLARALHGATRYYAGERDMSLPCSGGYLDWKRSDGNVLRLNDYVSLQNHELAELVRFPIIGAIASRLTGGGSIRLFHDQLIFKPPARVSRDTVVGWHTDRSYWRTCTSENMLTAWIPLVDVTVDMGCLRVLDRSHYWPGNDDMRTFNEQDHAGLMSRISTGDTGTVEVALPLCKGQISFHHAKTIHGSRENGTTKPRIALAVHLQDASNRYRAAVDKRGNPAFHMNDVMCRRTDGRSDYSDPAICPVLCEGNPVDAR